MLKILLWGFGVSMNMMYKLASLMDKNFKNRLQERNINIVIKTTDGSTARTFSLQNGKLRSVGQDHADADLSIAISGLFDFAKILFPINPQAIAKSAVDLIRRDKLVVEFKMESFMWFSMTFMQMLSVFTDRSKPKKFLFINA